MIANDQKEFLLQGYASLGLRQPAAAFVQAACCQTTDLPHSERLSTAGCGTESCSGQPQSKEEYAESQFEAVTIADEDPTLPPD